jgi:hypothetical protein
MALKNLKISPPLIVDLYIFILKFLFEEKFVQLVGW